MSSNGDWQAFLNERKEQIEKKIEQCKQAIKDHKGPGDELHAIRERERSKKTNLESALTRIGQGTYGRCIKTSCGKSISRERLRIMPEATTCMGCNGHS